MADDFDRFAFRREANDWDELSSLGAFDDAPPPNPRFVRALRGELMERAEAMSQPSSLQGRRNLENGAVHASLAVPPIQIPRRRWDRILTIEVAAVAILLIALIGSIASRGGGGGNETANGVINPPVLDSEHTSWMYRQDPARTNVSADSGPVTSPKLDWRATVDDGVIAVADGVIVTLAINSATMQGWSVETGEFIWTTTLDFMNPEVAAAGNGYVFLSQMSQDDPVVVAYDLKTGTQSWSSNSISSFASEPAVDDGKLYYMARNRTLQVVDTLTGKPLWSVDVTAEASKSTPNTSDDSTYINVINGYAVAVGDGVVLVTGGDSTITAYDLATHEVKWSLKTEGDTVSTPVIADGSVYFSSSRYNPPDGEKDDPHAAAWTYKVNATNGEVIWTRSSDPFAVVIGLIGTDALLLSPTTIISRADGTTVGSLPGDQQDPFGAWTFGKDLIYSVDGEGNLIAWTYDSATDTFSENWRAYLAIERYESSSGLMIVGDQLVARGPNSTLIALSADGAASDSAAASATPSALDFSGLTPCSPPPAIDYLNVNGDPTNTLQTTSAVLGDAVISGPVVDTKEVDGRTVSIVDDPTRQPWLSTDEVPTGTAASADVIAGIESTLQAIKDCDHPGVAADVSGFYSEDFYRRSWVQAQIEQHADIDPIGSLALTAGVYWLNEIQSVIVLDDGRVAVLGQPGFNQEPNDFSMFVVFVKQGDDWVIDESIRFGLFALMG